MPCSESMMDGERADTVTRSGQASPAETQDAGAGELKRCATLVKEALDAWAARVLQAAQSGRSATSSARMATARSLAEIRKLSLPVDEASMAAEVGEVRGLVANYLRQATNTVARAAHEIERNRYSFEAMQKQLEKLDGLYHRIYPKPEESDDQGKENVSGLDNTRD